MERTGGGGGPGPGLEGGGWPLTGLLIASALCSLSPVGGTCWLVGESKLLPPRLLHCLPDLARVSSRQEILPGHRKERRKPTSPLIFGEPGTVCSRVPSVQFTRLAHSLVQASCRMRHSVYFHSYVMEHCDSKKVPTVPWEIPGVGHSLDESTHYS